MSEYSISKSRVKGVERVSLQHLLTRFDYKEHKNQSILDLPCTPIQRNHERRASKMSKIFANYNPTMAEFSLQYLPERVKYESKTTGEVIDIDPGLYVSNGNTRLYCYNEGLNDIPKDGVDIKITEITNSKELDDEYYSTDSQSASEGTKDKLAGVCRHLSLNFVSPMKNHTFSTVIRHAYPFDYMDNIFDKVSYFKESLLLLDETMVFKPKITELKTAQFQTACLIFAEYNKRQKEAVKKVLSSIVNTDYSGPNSVKFSQDNEKQSVQGMTWILRSVTISKYIDKFYELNTMLGDRFIKPISFYLWCLENQLMNQTYERVPEKNYWVDSKRNMKESILNELNSNNNRFFI